MRKFWKILNNSDIENSMRYLHVNSDYIKVLLEEDSEFMKYLNKNNPKYVHISQSDTNGYKLNYNLDNFEGFGWGQEDDIDFFISYNYEFCGIIDFRKEKLKKLNKLYK